MTADHRIPSGLRSPGKRLWLSTLEVFEPSEDEAALLESACRHLDELREIERALRRAPVMVEGSRGQQRTNPLLGEARQHRLALARLLGVLGLEEGAEDGRGVTRSSEARKLALVRWHGKGQAS